MDADRFDAFVRSLSSAGTRRRVVRLLAALPLAEGLAALLGDATEAGRQRRRKARRHSGKDKDKDKVRNQRKRKGKGKDKNKGKKGKKKRATTCVNAGQTPRNGKRCCPGLVEDGSGICVQPVPSPGPSPRPCAETCAGCCAGETCITATNDQQCGSGGVQCAPCPHRQTCGGGNVLGVCGCTPTITCPTDQTCGEMDDGCGTISCGCTLPQTCGGGGTLGVCGCTPIECPSNACGIIDNRCGGTIDCGGCTGFDTCGAGTPPVPNVCGCAPIACPTDACGDIDDECGGILPCGSCPNPGQACVNHRCEACTETTQCSAHHLCVGGECQPCTVCDDPDACETSVQTAIDEATGGILYICPGVYTEIVTINKSLTLIGAGSANSAGDTTLNGEGSGSVVTITQGSSVALQSMRITGGVVTGTGGGILIGEVAAPAVLTMADCVVAGNRANGSNASGHGGGIFNHDGTLSMTGCSVLENTASGKGGGIYTDLGKVTLNDSHLTDNDANQGGGIYADFGDVTFNGVSTVTLNTSQLPGGGIFNANGGSVVLNDSTDVSSNEPDNCAGDAVNGTCVNPP